MRGLVKRAGQGWRCQLTWYGKAWAGGAHCCCRLVSQQPLPPPARGARLPPAAAAVRRAHVEVRRALHQNSICRAPLLNAQHSKGCARHRCHACACAGKLGLTARYRRGWGAAQERPQPVHRGACLNCRAAPSVRHVLTLHPAPSPAPSLPPVPQRADGAVPPAPAAERHAHRFRHAAAAQVRPGGGGGARRSSRRGSRPCAAAAAACRALPLLRAVGLPARSGVRHRKHNPSSKRCCHFDWDVASMACRALLDLDFEDAEFIEKEMAQGSTFSI